MKKCLHPYNPDDKHICPFQCNIKVKVVQNESAIDQEPYRNAVRNYQSVNTKIYLSLYITIPDSKSHVFTEFVVTTPRFGFPGTYC